MTIIARTKREETPDIVDIPISQLAEQCQDPIMLATIISLAHNQGYKLGQEQAHKYYSMMFAGQNETTIGN